MTSLHQQVILSSMKFLNILTHPKQDEALEPLDQDEQEELKVLKANITGKRKKLKTKSELLARSTEM